MAAKNSEQDICGVRVVHIKRVNRARDESIPAKELDHLAETYKVLGGPNEIENRYGPRRRGDVRL